MNLQLYMQQTPAPVEWHTEDDISLEQLMATAALLEEREEHIRASLEFDCFVMDVAKQYPDLDAFEQLGLEGHSVLQLGMEEQGKSWLRKVWDAIKNAIVRVYRAIRDFIGKLFKGYGALEKNFKKMKSEVESISDSKSVKVKVNTPSSLQVYGVVDPMKITTGLAGNVTNGNFFAVHYPDFVTDYYRSVLSRKSEFSEQIAEYNFSLDLEDLVNNTRQRISKSKYAPQSDNPQIFMLGDYHFSMVTDDVFKPQVIRFKTPMKDSSVTIEYKDKDSIRAGIDYAIDAIDTAKKSATRTKDLLDLRDDVMEAYDAILKKDENINAKNHNDVNGFIRKATMDLVSCLSQYHRHNYNGLRAYSTLVQKYLKEVNK